MARVRAHAVLLSVATVIGGCAAPAPTSVAPPTTEPATATAPRSPEATFVASATPTAAPSVARSCELSVGAAQVVVARSRLVSLGFFGFPDGIFGTLKDGDRVTWYAAHARPEPSGPHQRAVPPAAPKQASIARLVGTLDDPAAFEAKPAVPISGMKAALDYIGGGPIYRDAASGMLLLLYHAERWPGGQSDQFWASYGLARSTDGGQSWIDLGEFYQPEVAFVDSVPAGTAANARAVAVPAAAYVIVNGFFYVYAKDRSAYDKPTTFLTVARARVADVVSAAQSGRVTPWTKYFNGAWSEPGLGGKASGLETGNPQVRNSDVAFSQATGRYVMVVIGAVSADKDVVSLIESEDGINWGPRRVIDDGPYPKLFPTIVGLGGDPRVVGAQFNVYYPRNKQNQPDTDLLRRVISCR